MHGTHVSTEQPNILQYNGLFAVSIFVTFKYVATFIFKPEVPACGQNFWLLEILFTMGVCVHAYLCVHPQDYNN